MQRVQITWRWRELAAAIGAIALVSTAVAVGPAQAAPGLADIQITKTVAGGTTGTKIDESQFIAAIKDVRNNGTFTFTDDGLRVRTTGTPDKVAQYWPQSGPIPSTATIAWTQDEGIHMPGMQIVFDADGILGNGIADWNVLVNVPTDNGSNWWLPNTAANSAQAKLAAPSCNNPGPACVGNVNGSPYYGTLAGWIAALPSAQVYAVGLSLGSGAGGINSGVISNMTYGAHSYTFGGYSSSKIASPGDTLEYKLDVGNASDAGIAATGVVVADTLPAELTYVPGTLIDNGNGCAFDPAGKVLTCNAGTFPAGVSTTIKFKAEVDDQVSTEGQASNDGHWVDVQKQEVFADFLPNQTRTYVVNCPSGYIPTDGGLLVDAVDQGGFYSDLVILTSEPSQSGGAGWTVRAKNFGDHRAQGKVKVTCLNSSLGSTDGHTHPVTTAPSTGTGQFVSIPTATTTVQRHCPAGYTPIAPAFRVDQGIPVVRSSIAVNGGSSWEWVVDHSANLDMTFALSCLAPKSGVTSGHSAELQLSTESDTILFDPDSRGEGTLQCPRGGNGLVGGFEGDDPGLLSLGKESRGNTYMFRFVNDDWAAPHTAGIQVVCAGYRTAPEPAFHHVVNTATVSTTAPETNTSNNTSSAHVAVNGDPSVAAPNGVTVDATGARTVALSKTTRVNLDIRCTAACSFTVRVLYAGDVVAKKTTALVGAPGFQAVQVPTTSAGQYLGPGLVKVKIKTASGTTVFPVTLG